MIRIPALATAHTNLAAAQPVLIAAQLAHAAAQADVTAKEAALTAAEMLPLDTFTSTADGLAGFLDESGNVLPGTTIYILGYAAQTGINGGQPMLGPISAAAFPIGGAAGPGQMTRDASSRLQFVTGGSEIPPLSLTLLVVQASTEVDGAPVTTTVGVSWE